MKCDKLPPNRRGQMIKYTVSVQFKLMKISPIFNKKKSKYSDLPKQILNYIGIKHGFSCINIRQVPWEVLKTKAEGIRQVPWEVLKTKAEGLGFQHLPRDLANVNALKNHVRSLLLHKN